MPDKSALLQLDVPLVTELVIDDGSGGGTCVALGTDALLVECDLDLSSGTRVAVHLPLPGSPLELDTEVRWSEPAENGKTGFGLVLSNTRPNDRDVLAAFITRNRKGDHIRICLEEDVATQTLTAGFESIRLPYQALPEIAKSDVDLSVEILGKTLKAPILISCMTGGSERAAAINRALAEAAQQCGVAMGLGSQRILLEDEGALTSFAVRDVAPDILLIGNIGAVQLNYGVGKDDIERLADMVGADAMAFHLNPLQEAIQPEGDTDFTGLIKKMAAIVPALSVPAVMKEIGCGISGDMATKVADVGFSAIDVAGAGGTSWARVEGHRARDPRRRALGERFGDWGIPTAQCIREVHAALPGMTIISSGGVRTGVDIAKSIALGASCGAMARPFLVAAEQGTAAVVEVIEQHMEEIRIAMFCAGIQTIQDLQNIDVDGS